MSCRTVSLVFGRNQPFIKICFITVVFLYILSRMLAPYDKPVLEKNPQEGRLDTDSTKEPAISETDKPPIVDLLDPTAPPKAKLEMVWQPRMDPADLYD